MNSNLMLKLECIGGKIVFTTDRLKACRGCLSTECKLIDLFSNNLAEQLSELTGTAVQLGDGLPQQLCTICCALLRKGTVFRKKCRTARDVLLTLVEERSLTTSSIRNLKPTQLQLQLTKTNINVINIPPSISEDISQVSLKQGQCTLSIEYNGPDADENHGEVDGKFDNIKTENNVDAEDKCFIKSDDEIMNSYYSDDESIVSNTIDDKDFEIENKAEVYVNATEMQLKINSNTNKNYIHAHSHNKANNVENGKIFETVYINDKNKSGLVLKEKSRMVKNDCTKVDNASINNYVQEKINNSLMKIQNTSCNSFVNEDKTARNSTVEENIFECNSVIENNAANENLCSNIHINEHNNGSEKKSFKNKNFAKKFSEKYNFDVSFVSKEEQLKELEDRKEMDSYKKANYQCRICYKGFMKENAYINHMDIHDPSNGAYTCEFCKAYYSQKMAYTNHMRKHKMYFKCRSCRYNCKTPDKAQTHHKWHSGVTYKCEYCALDFRRLTCLKNHVRKNHGTSLCQLCGETFVGLKTHMVKVHRLQLKYHCATCGIHFRNAEALDKHRSLTKDAGCDKDNCPCDYCGDSFITKHELVDHLQTLHGLNLRCDKCQVTLSNETEWKQHQYKVHREWRPNRNTSRARVKSSEHKERKSHLCDSCGLKCKSKTLLTLHYRVHTGEKPHQCTDCPKSFRSAAQLQYHLNIHQGLLPYKCPHCPKTFATPSNRTRHVRVHTKERPFACHICGKTYQQSNCLKMHVRTTHLKEPWPKRVRSRSTKQK